jgi:hypothetical protein
MAVDLVWANNHGGDGGDSGEYVRQVRDADRKHEVDQAQEVSRQDPADERTDAEVGDALFASLDLPR